MKINELTGIKNSPKLPKLTSKRIVNNDFLYEEIKELLIKNGFKFIDSGAFGLVFLGNHSILKIFANDPAYEAYVKFIKSLPSKFKSFAPKITSIRTYPQNPNIKFVKMPKYFKLTYNDRRLLLDLNDILHEFGIRTDLTFQMFDTKEELIKFINKNIKLDDGLYYTIMTLEKKDFELFNFMMYIASKNPDISKFKNDMHHGNFMKDEKQNIILIDPWATLEGLSEI